MADLSSNRLTRRDRVRRRRGALSLALAVAALIGLSAPPAPAGAPVAFEVDNLHSNKAMDVFGASVDPGASIVQWTPNGGDNQAWRVLPFSSVGDFDLVILQSVHSGLVLDIGDHSTGAGSELMQLSWAARAGQLWIVYPFGDTELSLIINVETGMVADVAGASKANGAAVIQWPWHGGANQLWAFLV